MGNNKEALHLIIEKEANVEKVSLMYKFYRSFRGAKKLCRHVPIWTGCYMNTEVLGA